MYNISNVPLFIFCMACWRGRAPPAAPSEEILRRPGSSRALHLITSSPHIHSRAPSISKHPKESSFEAQYMKTNKQEHFIFQAFKKIIVIYIYLILSEFEKCYNPLRHHSTAKIDERRKKQPVGLLTERFIPLLEPGSFNIFTWNWYFDTIEFGYIF